MGNEAESTVVFKRGLERLLKAPIVTPCSMNLQMKTRMKSTNLPDGECVFMNLWRPL